MQRIVTSYIHGDRTHKDIIDGIYANLELVPYAAEVVAQVQTMGYQTALVSGSFDVYVARAAQLLGIKDIFACTTIVFDEQGFVNRFDHSGDEHAAKLQYLTGEAKRRGFALDQCICVADGPNDRDMFLATRKGITFPGTEVEEHAWKVIDTIADLPKVL